uniref:Hypothetical conserved protein n=1 Tax=uncultured delta proteobacterium TaxID=34034 RepID=H5SJF0_9DELT|nr:hypothetical conserved protein [uncultured delta proteobacterium]
MTRGNSSGVREVLDGDDVRQILRDTFFSSLPASGSDGAETSSTSVRRRRKNKQPGPRPEHYKVICISMYTRDLERLDAVVQELKRRGFTKANRSAVLRIAMEQLQIDRIPRGL